MRKKTVNINQIRKMIREAYAQYKRQALLESKRGTRLSITEAKLRQIIKQELIREAQSMLTGQQSLSEKPLPADTDVGREVEKAMMNIMSSEAFEDRITALLKPYAAQAASSAGVSSENVIDHLVDVVMSKITGE